MYCTVPDEATLKIIAMDILHGLDKIHRNGIIHCDIKPENFLVFRTDSNLLENEGKDLNMSNSDSFSTPFLFKVADFGMAHIIAKDSEKAYIKYRCGTHAYIAPELTDVRIGDNSI